MTKFQITGIVGAGYREVANFNPREGAWETRSVDAARYDIGTRAEAEELLKDAQADSGVQEVEIEEIKAA